MCYITEEKTGFFIVVTLFVFGVIFIWGSFTSCFFQSNDKWTNAFNRNIFIFKFYVLLFFLYKDIFSLSTTYDIPFLQIHTTIYFLLVSCFNLSFISKDCMPFQNGLRHLNTWKISSLQIVSFFFKKHTLPLKMERYVMMNSKDSCFSLIVKPTLVVLLLVL